MVEFGEQLRKAREAKGMTQQSLAEQLYVTRQTVSRWECGDRYPDLLTVKKLSVILEISLDDLLSGKEMTKVAERNPVVENKMGNNMMIALFAAAVISYVMILTDTVLGQPAGSVSGGQNYLLNAAPVLSLAIQIAVFSYGLLQAVRETLSPKKMGLVVIGYFVSVCIAAAGNVLSNRIYSYIITGILPAVLGAAAAYCWFIRGSISHVWTRVIYGVSVWGIFTTLMTVFSMIRNGGSLLTMNFTVNIVLKIAVYMLIIFGTGILKRKRDNAREITQRKHAASAA